MAFCNVWQFLQKKKKKKKALLARYLKNYLSLDLDILTGDEAQGEFRKILMCYRLLQFFRVLLLLLFGH